jgi:hypothetical protein
VFAAATAVRNGPAYAGLFFFRARAKLPLACPKESAKLVSSPSYFMSDSFCALEYFVRFPDLIFSRP